MDSEQIKRERAAFEAWWCEDIGVPEHHRKRFTGQLSPCLEKYTGTEGHTAWRAWLARAEQNVQPPIQTVYIVESGYIACENFIRHLCTSYDDALSKVEELIKYKRELIEEHNRENEREFSSNKRLFENGIISKEEVEQYGLLEKNLVEYIPFVKHDGCDFWSEAGSGKEGTEYIAIHIENIE